MLSIISDTFRYGKNKFQWWGTFSAVKGSPPWRNGEILQERFETTICFNRLKWVPDYGEVVPRVRRVCRYNGDFL